MKTNRIIAVIIGILAAAAIAYGAGLATSLHFAKAGFSISALEGEGDLGAQQVVMLFLPPTEQFAPNVNVQIQSFAEGLEEYLKFSIKQIGDSGWVVQKQASIGGGIAVIEYTGNMSGQALHWYSRAVKAGKRVYLVTGTARQSQWRSVSTAIINCVDSFKLDAER